MTQPGKTLATKPNNLSLIPGTHTVGDSRLLLVAFCYPYIGMRIHPHQ